MDNSMHAPTDSERMSEAETTVTVLVLVLNGPIGCLSSGRSWLLPFFSTRLALTIVPARRPNPGKVRLRTPLPSTKFQISAQCQQNLCFFSDVPVLHFVEKSVEMGGRSVA